MIQWSIIWRKNIFAQWFAQRLVDSGIFEGEIWKKPTTWVWNFVCWKYWRKSRSSIFFSFSGKGTKQTHLWTSEKSSKNFLFGTASLTGTTSETQKAHYFIQICEGFAERLTGRVKYSMLLDINGVCATQFTFYCTIVVQLRPINMHMLSSEATVCIRDHLLVH